MSIVYELISETVYTVSDTDEFEASFGDESLVANQDVLVQMLGHLAPPLSPQERDMWTALWRHDVDPNRGSANDYFMSGITSGEQINRAYTLQLTSGTSDSPAKVAVLHRDASGECVSNGNIGVFAITDDTFDFLSYGSYSDDPLMWNCFSERFAPAVEAVLQALRQPGSQDRMLRDPYE